jgi:ATP-dependent DNA helicase DinG
MAIYRSEEQADFAARVFRVIVNPGAPALLHAGTGIGKTRGYLVPALGAAAAGKRVLIATATCQLIRQISGSTDMVAAMATTDVPVQLASRIGLSQFVSPSRAALVGIDAVLGETIDDVLEREPDANPAQICLTPRCPDAEREAYASQAALCLAASIVITTHAALLLDRRTGGKLINADSFDVIIVDEADQLPAAAVSAFDSVLTEDAIRNVADALDDLGHGGKDMRKAADRFHDATANDTSAVAEAARLIGTAVLAARKETIAVDLLDALDRLSGLAAAVVSTWSAPQAYSRLVVRPGRVRIANRHPARVLSGLWQQGKAIILTSGTLSVNGRDFNDFRIACGINAEHSASAIIEPRKHGDLRLFLAKREVPPPRGDAHDSERGAWLDYVAAGVREAATDGERVLVLTNSYADTRELAGRLTDMQNLLEHRQGSRLKPLLGRLGPSTIFISPAAWSGVDIENAFGHIVIPRIPFPAPDEELIEAFGIDTGIAYLDARAAAARRLRQGIGRGLRSPRDFCVLWILDPRFPLPARIINEGRATQRAAANMLQLAEAIPERFRRGMHDAYRRAEIFEPMTR